MRLFDLPHAEAKRLLATGAPVFLTVNPVEYHGPHLSLHNDRLVSEGLVRDLHARLAPKHPDWPLLVGADLEVGVEPCWGPGSRHTAFLAVRQLVCEACRALAELGARRVVLMTFHGGPLHNLALDEGVSLLASRGVRALSPFNLVLRALLTLDPTRFEDALAHVEDAAVRAEMLQGLPSDFHAGFFETSMALLYAPDSVGPERLALPPCPRFPLDPAYRRAAQAARALGRVELARELDFAALGMGWFKLTPFPGYTSRPSLATREAGAIFARFMLDQFEVAVEDVLGGGAKPPRPIMRWAARASLSGRIGGAKVTVAQMAGIDP